MKKKKLFKAMASIEAHAQDIGVLLVEQHAMLKAADHNLQTVSQQVQVLVERMDGHDTAARRHASDIRTLGTRVTELENRVGVIAENNTEIDRQALVRRVETVEAWISRQGG